MALLRTKRLAVHHTPVRVGFEDVYVVPAGKRAVIRDLRISNQGGALVTQTLLLLRTSGGTEDLYLVSQDIGPNEIVGAQADVVLEVGDVVKWNAGADNMTVWISGAELDLPE